MEERLEVRMNLNEAYEEGIPAVGMVTKHINPMERERYSEGTLRDLLKYMIKEEPGLDPDQKDVQTSVRGYLNSEAPNNPVIVALYDDDNRRFPEESDLGAQYIDTIVADIIPEDATLLNMGVYQDPDVGGR